MLHNNTFVICILNNLYCHCTRCSANGSNNKVSSHRGEEYHLVRFFASHENLIPCNYRTFFKNSASISNLAEVRSEFQQQVCKALQRIPIGNTLTYRELADRLKTSARAIGQACRRNPFPIVIPCHRIVAQQGLGGYHGASQGPMATVKRWLLRHEQNALKRPTN